MVRNFLKNESGYSLVEVVVAILLLSIAIIPMVAMFDSGLRAAVLGGNYDRARAIANEKLEETKTLSFSGALARYPEGGPTACTPAPPAGSPITSCQVTTEFMSVGSDSMESSPVPTTLARVTVRVEWPGGDYETTGLVSR